MNGAKSALYVFDADIIIGGGVHQVVFANSTLAAVSLALDIRITSEGLVISEATDEALVESESGFIVAGITDTTEFDFRVEIYRFATTGGDKQVAKIFVNDEYVGCTVISGKKVPTDAIEAVAVYHKVKEDASITFDNVTTDVVSENVAYIPAIVNTRKEEQ